MSVVAMAKSETTAPAQSEWVSVAAGTALVTGGLLLLSGRRKAGLAVAAAGTALALVEHEDTVRQWWTQLPAIVNETQRVIEQVRGRVSRIAGRRSTGISDPELLRQED